MKVLVTGAAGFVGYHLCRRLIREGMVVVGLDNLNDYYSVNLKYTRLDHLGIKIENLETLGALTQSQVFNNFSFIKCDLCDESRIMHLFEEQKFDVVINLAAQAGVRYSLENPHAYTASNIEGFLNILEGCRQNPVSHLIFASSSSVYGMNSEMPFDTDHRTDQPVSLYAATKKANELIAHTYAHLYGIPCTGLRFFTVYGALGRPDMAYFKFANLIMQGESIDVYNDGKMGRDFTYIDDIVESLVRLIPKPAIRTKTIPYQIFNIGNGNPVSLMDFITILERLLGKKSHKNMLPMQAGDVEKTWANVDQLYEYIDYRPKVNLEEGLSHFVQWYVEYYGLNQEKLTNEQQVLITH
ncbi:MAG: NAD-dependent epimerase/dehydratase family protein [Balneolales bacterium]|nr:NAD-dependent epimerase/dehydratase family protein [Balneolales bacterium]